VSFAVAASMLGERVLWSAAFVAGPLVVLGNCLPITPGGVGTAEAVSSELFACFGSAQGAEMMILVRISSAILTLPGVAAFLRLPATSEHSSSPEHSKPSGQSKLMASGGATSP
jgi:uncharacterized membrane protein YbhN (UPF0104 family)